MENFIKFLGTAGARFVMIKQLRSSAGIWLKFNSTNVFIDPGPGSIVKCNKAKPKLDPSNLDAIILTHKHLDHSGDINVMIEALTHGRFKKRGVLFVPKDAIGVEGVVYSYLENSLEKIIFLKKGKFSIGNINFEVLIANKHPGQTYGLKFNLGGNVVSFISDTRYFEKLVSIYEGSSVLILNVVFHKRQQSAEHLCLDDALNLIKAINPKKTILTHFGMGMLKKKPYLLEKKVKEQLKGRDIKFAYDGFSLDLDALS